MQILSLTHNTINKLHAKVITLHQSKIINEILRDVGLPTCSNFILHEKKNLEVKINI